MNDNPIIYRQAYYVLLELCEYIWSLDNVPRDWQEYGYY